MPLKVADRRAGRVPVEAVAASRPARDRAPLRMPVVEEVALNPATTLAVDELLRACSRWCKVPRRLVPVRMTNDFSSSEISPLHFGWHPMLVHAAGQHEVKIRKGLQAEEIATRRPNSGSKFKQACHET